MNRNIDTHDAAVVRGTDDEVTIPTGAACTDYNARAFSDVASNLPYSDKLALFGGVPKIFTGYVMLKAGVSVAAQTFYIGDGAEIGNVHSDQDDVELSAEDIACIDAYIAQGIRNRQSRELASMLSQDCNALCATVSKKCDVNFDVLDTMQASLRRIVSSPAILVEDLTFQVAVEDTSTHDIVEACTEDAPVVVEDVVAQSDLAQLSIAWQATNTEYFTAQVAAANEHLASVQIANADAAKRCQEQMKATDDLNSRIKLLQARVTEMNSNNIAATSISTYIFEESAATSISTYAPDEIAATSISTACDEPSKNGWGSSQFGR